MDTIAYLKRIGYRGPVEPGIHTLINLHRAHLLTVPFENLDIHLGRPIVLDDGALFDKIVTRRRGGFCYELNGLFCALLRTLGFRVSMLCAEVARPEGGFGPLFDHMTLLVELDRPWIADVGFGDSFLEPLLLQPDLPQYQWGRAYRITHSGQGLLYQSLSSERRWNNEYRFRQASYQYDDFGEMCLYHQTSPQSSFTRKRVCSRATPDGRVTISDRKLIVTRNGVRIERELKDGEYAVALREYFGVMLGGTVGP